MSARDHIIEFDPAAHEYRVAGTKVPNVTGLLAPLCSWEMVDPDVLDRKCALGRAVHLATEFDDRGTLDESTLSDEIRGYLEAWRLFRAEMKPTILHAERPVYHGVHRYAGTLDREVMMQGNLAIIDIKSGIKHRVHGVQIAAYALARMYEEGWANYPKRYGAYLGPNGRYELVEYSRTTDYAMFLSMLNTHYWRSNP